MKLATYQDGSRDGQLVVVSRDLTTAHYATGVASKLQQVLDDWNFMSPQLQDVSFALNQGKARHAFPFDAARCMAPLPRAYQWVDGAAYLSHTRRLCRASGADWPAALDATPLMQQGSSDDFSGAHDPMALTSAAVGPGWGLDFEAKLAVITGDVALAARPAQALDRVRLLMLGNSAVLRPLDASAGISMGVGLPPWRCHTVIATAFSPVAVTPDELVGLGDNAWRDGCLHLSVQSTVNGRKLGMVESGSEMTFGFGELIAQVCASRRMRAGSVVGSGCVSHSDASRGTSCLAEKRALDLLDGAPAGQPGTPYLAAGDTVRVEIKGKDGVSVFGAIAQTVT